MHILMTMAGLGGGGAESFFERLACAFAGRGHSVTAAIRPVLRRAAALSEAGVSVQTMRFGGAVDFATPRKVKHLIRQSDADVVLSFMSRAARAVPPMKDIPHVARLGGYYALKNYRTAHHLVGNTQDICDWLVTKGAPADSVSYIPNFVEKGSAAPLSRSGYQTPSDAKLVVALGRLHRNKAFDTLIEAMAHQNGTYLWLAGEGPERASLDALVAKHNLQDRVRFLGWMDNPGPVIAAADLVCVPSRHEPLGNVVLEAWSYAKPVVATEAVGPATLIENGANGILSPVDDPNALSNAITAILHSKDHGAALGTAGERTLQSRFSADTIVQDYIALFERLRGARLT